jgi:hypothetical protein
MEPVTLATTIVVTFLRPYIEKGAAKVAEAVSDKVGKAAADFAVDTASKAWNYIKQAFQSGKEKLAVDAFENYPKESEELLKTVLTEKLAQDKELAQKLEQLVNAQGPNGSTSLEIMNNAGVVGVVNITHSNISGNGTVIKGVDYHAAPPSSSAAGTGKAGDDASKKSV